MEKIERIAADVGGTFTDIAAVTKSGVLITRKVSSTPADYSIGIVEGIADLLHEARSEAHEVEEILHGCTVATNAILELDGARTALLTTKGFRDVLELRRTRVPTLYDPLYEKPIPLVPRQLRFEVDERMSAGGEPVRPVDRDEVLGICEVLKQCNIEAIAIVFLHAYQNAEHEKYVAEIVSGQIPDAYVSVSSEVWPHRKEYERTSTTVVNAYVGPPVAKYLNGMRQRLKSIGFRANVHVIQSSGGTLGIDAVIRKPAGIVECGPAAGVVAAQHYARQAGLGDLITLDMGGTTAKASIIQSGVAIYTDEYEVGGGMSTGNPLVSGGGYALCLPSIDISEVGAGGGSIAWLDKVSALKIGPKSAGAVPGPACYALGNTRPTVTDANVVLGYLNNESMAGGTVPIDAALSERAVSDHIARPMKQSLLDAAFGIHTVANAQMMRAVKAVTTSRGRDPRGFSILAFGGNGGIHATDLARALHVTRVIVPVAAGVFSAVGLLYASEESSESMPYHALLTALDTVEITSHLDELSVRAGKGMSSASADEAMVSERYVSARFVGQAFEIAIPFPQILSESLADDLERTFRRKHKELYGHDFSGGFNVEVVGLRVVVIRRSRLSSGLAGKAPGKPKPEASRKVYFGPRLGRIRTSVVARDVISEHGIEGPLVVEDYEGTVVVPPRWKVHKDSFDNLIMDNKASGTAAGRQA